MSSTEGQPDTRPARGTRPANRRELILDAAEDLFYTNGFANVGMSDIAEAVAIGPSAMYRHVRSKHELLTTVIAKSIEALDKMLAESSPKSAELAEKLAETMIAHRAMGVLARREARSLTDESRAAILDQVRGVGVRLSSMIEVARPGIAPAESRFLSWCVLAAGTSISFHSLKLPHAEFVRLLAGVIETVLDADVPSLVESSTSAQHSDVLERSRRETILAAAVKLFAEHGYSNVGIEEIGAAVGIAGPSVYNHFDSKAEVLMAAMVRGDEQLRADMNRTLARADSASDGVRRLLRSYCEFAFEYPQMIQLLITEIVQLPSADQHRMRATQHDYIAEWVRLLRVIHPDWDQTSARIRAQAVISVINDIAMTPYLRRYSNLDESVIDLGGAMLDVGPPV
ncbi:TetR/AcrR family transcriptional regulator [Antrihabitans sp. YC2-6]|uniref:TetR/AcrR family transcriptional regulator n=1 Tax=Antrihabitans sp. YC2-6 TaxID=2799498 RepID=UPI0018F535E4|nr:TetR/AcrR family transcriptional regulator [Antrihabitans sp. YC2-6]MBJ8344239.1 TetR/AcrR family transcriptional regulator [Antrihabitans sp. YC2-6]